MKIYKISEEISSTSYYIDNKVLYTYYYNQILWLLLHMA